MNLKTDRYLIGICLGIVIIFKLWLIWQLPICAFHNDSHTYLRTARMFWQQDWHIGVHPKRAFLYPIFLTLIQPIPGRINLHILFFQHVATFAAILLMARLFNEWNRSFKSWNAILILLLGFNVPILFYSHDMIAEAFYFTTYWFFLWCLWQFLKESSPSKASKLFWSAAFCIALRPDGKMIVAATIIIVISEWIRRRLFSQWHEWLRKGIVPFAACLLLWLTSHVTQQGWLFYSSVFPLTNLDSPLHAEYKQELRPLVEEMRLHLAEYPKIQGEIQWRLINPKDQSIGPYWDQLRSRGQNPRLHRISKDLAIEAVKTHPIEFLRLMLFKIGYVFQTERNTHLAFDHFQMGRDYVNELASEPGYIPLLFSSEVNWLKWRNVFFADETDRPVEIVTRTLEPWSSPKWGSIWGILSLSGWLIALHRFGPRLAIWLGFNLLYLLLTFTIARAIPRYLLPFEPLLPLGLCLLGSEITFWIQNYVRNIRTSTSST